MDFETHFKSKLYEGKVYPVTGAILREKLAAVPQKAEISVEYSNYFMSDRRRAQLRKGIRKVKAPNYIIQAQYSCRNIPIAKPKLKHAEGEATAADTLAESLFKWSMMVKAIPSEQLNLVRESLEADGYAKFVAWFVEKHKLAGTFGYHEFGLVLEDDAIKYIERSV